MSYIASIRVSALGITAAACVALGACSQDKLLSIQTKTDEFSQNAAAAIDVLWVIDNSESMEEEQQGLGESFQAFIDTLIESNVDYHIGVISTDPENEGRLHFGAHHIAFLDSTTADAQAIFLENVKVGTNGTRLEQGLATAALTLGKGGSWRPGDAVTPPNTDFLRDEASLFVIMVSDEDDNSFGPVDYYRRLFESYKGAGNESRVSVSAIVGPTDDDAPGCFVPQRGSAAPGYRYVDLAGQTGGIFTSICDEFNESLASLSITAAGLKSVFTLASVPNPQALIPCDDAPLAELCVRVNGVALAKGNNRAGWTFEADTNSVVFGTESVPKPQSRILVEYQELRQ